MPSGCVILLFYGFFAVCGSLAYGKWQDSELAGAFMFCLMAGAGCLVVLIVDTLDDSIREHGETVVTGKPAKKKVIKS